MGSSKATQSASQVTTQASDTAQIASGSGAVARDNSIGLGSGASWVEGDAASVANSTVTINSVDSELALAAVASGTSVASLGINRASELALVTTAANVAVANRSLDLAGQANDNAFAIAGQIADTSAAIAAHGINTGANLATATLSFARQSQGQMLELADSVTDTATQAMNYSQQGVATALETVRDTQARAGQALITMADRNAALVSQVAPVGEGSVSANAADVTTKTVYAVAAVAGLAVLAFLSFRVS